MNVDLPEPDGPTRKTHSPLSIVSETLRSPTTSPGYRSDAFSKTIIGVPGRCGARGERSSSAASAASRSARVSGCAGAGSATVEGRSSTAVNGAAGASRISRCSSSRFSM